MIATTRNRAPSFTAACWIQNGGSALALEPTAPTNLASITGIATNVSGGSRIIQVPKGIFVGSGLIITALILDGSSTLIGRFWWLDSVLDLWVPNGAPVTLTVGSTNSGQSTVGCMPGAVHHFQVTTNAGAATKVAILIR